MSELYVEFIISLAPIQTSLASFPLHGVWLDAINRPKPHLVELSLRSHSSYIESQSFSIFHSLNTEVEPCPVVANLGVWKPITRHIHREFSLAIVICSASTQITRIKSTRDHNAVAEIPCIVLRMCVVNKYIIKSWARSRPNRLNRRQICCNAQ